jgi:hypothetical protein
MFSLTEEPFLFLQSLRFRPSLLFLMMFVHVVHVHVHVYISVRGPCPCPESCQLNPTRRKTMQELNVKKNGHEDKLFIHFHVLVSF